MRLLLHNAPQVPLLSLDQVVGDVVVLPRQLLQDLISVDRPIRWTRIEPVEGFSDEPDLHPVHRLPSPPSPSAAELPRACHLVDVVEELAETRTSRPRK